HVDAPGHVRPLLGHRGEERGKMIDRTDVVTADHLQDLLGLGAVEMLARAAGEPLERHHAQIGSNHLGSAVTILQSRDQLRADLAERAGDQYPPHVPSTPLGSWQLKIAPTVPKGCSIVCLWLCVSPHFAGLAQW